MSWLLRTSSWILLAGWFGSYSLFAFVIAPTAFTVLPSHHVAGELVSPVLRSLHQYGIAAGALLGLLAWVRRQGPVTSVLPLILAGLCAFSEYRVTPAITAVEPHAFGEAVVAEAAQQFSRLHQASRFLFGLILVGVLALIGLHARAEVDPRGQRPAGTTADATVSATAD